MRKLFYFFLTIFSFSALAQNQSGIINYEFKIDMHKRIQDEQMRAMIPKYRISKYELLFTPIESLYRPIVEDEEPETNSFSSNGANVTIKTQTPQNEVYKNFTTNILLNERELAGKKYLIEDSIKNIPWKILTDTKTIAGYNCLKAIYENVERKQTFNVWFTSDIVTPSGPEAIAGLPGMILEMDINNGETVITATKITFKELKSEIKAPSKGKKVTQKEFNKIRDDFMKEMNMNGGPNIRIIRN
ncbi:MAG: GLPGLI family protein [Spirosomataceae bacterium]